MRYVELVKISHLTCSPWSPSHPGSPTSPTSPGSPSTPGCPGIPSSPVSPGAPMTPCNHDSQLHPAHKDDPHIPLLLRSTIYSLSCSEYSTQNIKNICNINIKSVLCLACFESIDDFYKWKSWYRCSVTKIWWSTKVQSYDSVPEKFLCHYASHLTWYIWRSDPMVLGLITLVLTQK